MHQIARAHTQRTSTMALVQNITFPYNNMHIPHFFSFSLFLSLAVFISVLPYRIIRYHIRRIMTDLPGVQHSLCHHAMLTGISRRTRSANANDHNGLMQIANYRSLFFVAPRRFSVFAYGSTALTTTTNTQFSPVHFNASPRLPAIMGIVAVHSVIRFYRCNTGHANSTSTDANVCGANCTWVARLTLVFRIVQMAHSAQSNDDGATTTLKCQQNCDDYATITKTVYPSVCAPRTLSLLHRTFFVVLP